MFTKLNKLGFRSFSTSSLDLIQLKPDICPFVVRQFRQPEFKPLVIDEIDLIGNHHANKQVSVISFPVISNALIQIMIELLYPSNFKKVSNRAASNRFFPPKNSPTQSIASLSSSFCIQNETKKQLNHFVNERIAKQHPKINPTNLMLSILSDKRMLKTKYTDAYWQTLARNAKLLADRIGEEKLNECLPLLNNTFLEQVVDFLDSFAIEINSSNLTSFWHLRLMNNEELSRAVWFSDGARDLVERRLQLIDYLSEQEKTEIFRQDKEQLLQLSLVCLNDVMNTRLLEKFFHVEYLSRDEVRKSFMNLNSILRSYSKFAKRKIYFLDYRVLTRTRLSAAFFNEIIDSLPADYFDSSVNISKLENFFSPHKKMEENFRFIRQCLPSLSTVELINLLSLEYPQKHFETLIRLFLRAFVLEPSHAHELLFKYIEYLPNNPESIDRLIKKLMTLPDRVDEPELVRTFLDKQAGSRSVSRYRFKSNLGLLQSILKRDPKFIYQQLKKHPFYNKTSLGDVSLTIQYLLDEGLTLDQINDGLTVVLYSVELIKEALEALKQEEFYERIKDRDNFLDYVLYFIERNSAFTGKAVFMRKDAAD